MCRAFIPQFREQGAGAIVNVTSSVTLAPVPLVAAYTASKTAVEGFTASLEHELRQFGVRVKLVEPGYGPSTSFAMNAQERIQGLIPAPYEAFARRVFASFSRAGSVTRQLDVAEARWQAANDASDQLRYPAGAEAQAPARRRARSAAELATL